MQKATFPLHPAQEDVYTDQFIHSTSPHYNIGGYIQIRGSLNKEIFYLTVDTLPLVFDVYKMRFDLSKMEPHYHFDDQYNRLEVQELDLSHHDDPQREARSWMQSRFNTPFSIEKENPLFEHCLIKIAPDEHWFFCRYHHLITDGYGFIVFVQYIARRYKSLADHSDLPFHPASYHAEAVKAVQYKTSAAYESDRKYWQERIREKPHKLLHKRYAPATGSDKKSAVYDLELKETERIWLNSIQLATQSTLQQLTIAALLIYFGKTSGQSECMFGIPVHKRASKQLRTVLGMVSGILPFKASFQPKQNIADLIKDITLSQKKDYRHHNYTIAEISRAINVNYGEGYLCDVIINYELLDFETNFDEHVKATIIQLTSEYQTNPLQLSWRDYGTQQPLQLHISYWNEYFSGDEMELFAQRILFIIRQFTDKLHKEAGSIDVIPPSERRLLESFNDTSQAFSQNKSIVNLWEEQVQSTQEAVAVVFGQKQLSYRELNERSNQLAFYLMSKGVKKETLVPICLQRCPEMIIAILGILKAGGAYVPIDPQYPPERIRYIIGDTNAHIIIGSEQSGLHLPGTSPSPVLYIDPGSSDIDNQPTGNPSVEIEPGQLAYVIYTSGSTGKPKGVLIEHKAVVNLIHYQTKFFHLAADEKVLQFSNYCFDASVEQIFLALFNGATLVLLREDLLLHTALFESFLQENKISHLHATPFFLETLQAADYPHLKRVIAGGDVCRKELATRWKNKVSFYNEYGPTETTITAIEYKDDTHAEPSLSVPIGKPVANTQVHIVNREDTLCPVGVPGELCISGVQVARGYLHLPGLTAEKFVADQTGTAGSMMYRTGDMGRWLPDGNIEYLGRADEQVKIRGYRIELGEIETVLQAYGAISQAVVLAKEDPQGNKRLACYIVPTQAFNREAVVSYLRNKLPEYMIPTLWVEMSSLPLTSNGKVDKKVLLNLDTDAALSDAPTAPGNDLEAALAGIWKDLLRVEKVGMQDNFFELGGHSLKAIQLISRIQERFQVQIDIKQVLLHPTIQELARILLHTSQFHTHEIERLPEQDDYELSHSQKRIWVLSHFKDGSVAYSVPTAYDLEGDVNVDCLKQAFDAVVERHEILRTVFPEKNGQPRQKILLPSASWLKIDEVDVKNHPDVHAAIKDFIRKESNQPFDLANGPLLRATLFHASDQKHILIFTIHHIISDGWSKSILIKEIKDLYKKYSTGANSNLLPLPIQYKDYAAWQSTTATTQAAYWKELFKNGVPVLNFPLDFKRPALISFSGARLRYTLDESFTSALEKMAADHNLTLNSLLLSVYGMYVGQYCQQEEVVIGSLTSGRNWVEVEDMVGVFMNFLPVRFSVRDTVRLSDYLKNSNDALLTAYCNQDYPFDLMVNDSIRERDASRNPFFDTMVNFHWENKLIDDVLLAESPSDQNELQIRPLPLSEEDFFHSVLDFMLDIEPKDHQLELYLSYNLKLFTRHRMNEFLNGFVSLLEKIVTRPDDCLSTYAVTPAAQTQIPEPKTNSAPLPPGLSVCICSSFVAEPILEYLDYWSKEFSLNTQVTFAPYNQVFQQLLNPDSLLNRNKGINVIFLRTEDWLRDQEDRPVAEQINMLNRTYADWIEAMEYMRKVTATPFLAGILPLSSTHRFASEVAATIEKMNKTAAVVLNGMPGSYLLDLTRAATLYEVEEVFDPVSDKLGHMPFTQEYYAALGTFLSRKLRAYIAPAYKVIALDCDNTLWKGICGEAGTLGVTIDEHFTYFQNFILEKYQEGFLLTLCSKNNEDDVWEVFDKHPGMIIKREHIAAHRLNWNHKYENIMGIAKELNVGLDSIIFFDDSSFEVEQMPLFCPEVLALALPDNPAGFSPFLDHIWALDRFQITEEDLHRNSMYRVEKLRKEEQSKFDLLNDFIRSLDIRINIRSLQVSDLQRAMQLSQRTNQFNLNGIKRSYEDLSEFVDDVNSLHWIIEVKDRFGDYGVVGLLLAKETAHALQLESCMLSCRVLGRQVEDYILNELKNHCISHNKAFIEAQFRFSGKNQPFLEFLTRTGWEENPQTDTYNLAVTHPAGQSSLIYEKRSMKELVKSNC